MIGFFFEDIEVGAIFEFGCYRFTEENMKRFAASYDPQAFHVSDEGARQGPFGRMSASGWHMTAAWMKCYVDAMTARRAAMPPGTSYPVAGASPGFKHLKWKTPVFAEDTLSCGRTVLAKRLSQSRPGWGIVTCRNFASNQSGAGVLEFESAEFVSTRNSAG